MRVCVCVRAHPPRPQVGVEPDGRVGADPSRLTDVVVGLTVHLPGADLPSEDLYVTWTTSCSGLNRRWTQEETGPRRSHPRQNLELGGKVLTRAAPGGVEIHHPVVPPGQDPRPERVRGEV